MNGRASAKGSNFHSNLQPEIFSGNHHIFARYIAKTTQRCINCQNVVLCLKYRRILANMVRGKNMAQLQALMVNGGSNPVEICRSSGARRRYQTICAPVSDFRPRTRPDDWNNFLLISLFVPYFPLYFGSNSSFTKCPHSFCLTIINLKKNLWQSIKDIQTKNLSCS